MRYWKIAKLTTKMVTISDLANYLEFPNIDYVVCDCIQFKDNLVGRSNYSGCESFETYIELMEEDSPILTYGIIKL